MSCYRALLLLVVSRVRSFLKATSKIALPVFIKTKKNPCSSHEQTLFPFNSSQTPPSAELNGQDQREASPRPRAAGPSLLPAAFLNLTVSAELNQFSGPLPISLILQQTAPWVRKGSVHIFKGTQGWRALLGCRCCDGDISALAFPLFLKLFYNVFSCIWWGTLKSSFSEAILEGSLHTAMCFLTLTLEL